MLWISFYDNGKDCLTLDVRSFKYFKGYTTMKKSKPSIVGRKQRHGSLGTSSEKTQACDLDITTAVEEEISGKRTKRCWTITRIYPIVLR